MGEPAQWTWPESPATPRDVIAGHFRNWGKTLAYDVADTLIIELATKGFRVERETDNHSFTGG